MSNQSPRTEESYRGARQLLIRFFGDVDMCSITFENVRDWRNWLLGWQKLDTVRGNIICLRMVLKFLRKRGHPVLDYENIPVAKREKRIVKWLNKQEIDEFIKEAARPIRGYSRLNRLRNVAIIHLLYEAGLRNGELCALNRDSIKNRTFTIVGKSRDPRIGFIYDKAEEAIQAYLAARDDNSKALFVSNQNGNRLTPKGLQLVFRKICARSSFEDITPHTIRHSFATKLLAKDMNLRFVGDLMGHVSLDTTKMYTHYENPQLRAAYEKAHEMA